MPPAMVLGHEWLVGATTISTPACAKPFARVETIRMGALADDEDQGGPAVAENFERLATVTPSVLARSDSAYVWRSREEANCEFRAIDGAAIKASGFSSIDIAGLAAVTGANDVVFAMGTGVSSSGRAAASRPRS